MDEPTASLDPDMADKTLTLIEELRQDRNLSILYTSHNMKEVTRVCDEVIFLDHGKIVAQDTPANLTRQISSATLCLTIDNNQELLKQYLREQNQPFSFLNNHTVTITLQEKYIPEVLFGISRAGVAITDIEIQKPTLEDVFLQIARKA
jgi:ABC-2 type transport system ATP-binding protein